MHVYLMRHGQTNYNVLGLCNDDPTEDVRLTQLGVEQSERAAEQLKDVSIDMIITSELPRTRQTAEIVNRGHGAQVRQHPAINDLRTGFNGRPSREHQRAIAGDRLHTRPPGGESLLEHRRRVLSFLDWLKGTGRESVLVVAHEETLRVCVAYFRGFSDDGMLNITVGNCQIFHFELDPTPLTPSAPSPG